MGIELVKGLDIAMLVFYQSGTFDRDCVFLTVISAQQLFAVDKFWPTFAQPAVATDKIEIACHSPPPQNNGLLVSF